jgi:hypothetical protein
MFRRARNRKHKAIVTKILSDLDQVSKGAALKVPVGAIDGHQGEGAVRVESGDPEERAQRGDGQRWHLSVCVE